jgi:hypothetical protein
MARRRFMQSFSGSPVRLLFAPRTHPALTSYTDEVCATVARLFAYMGTLALLGILAVHGWDQLQFMLDDEPLAKPGWSTTNPSNPAFAASRKNLHDKSASYTQSEGGPRPTADWMTSTENPQLRGAF